MIDISPDTSIADLLKEYPFLADFLVDFNPRFRLLKNPVMRATAGRVANLRKVSEIGGVEINELMEVIRREVARNTTPHPKAPEKGPGESSAVTGVDPERVAELKELILDLHGGVAPETARARFDAVIKNTSPREIGAMEEQLIKEGMPVEEIQRLCDLHVAVVQNSLDRQGEIEAPPGHPIDTYLRTNEVITDLANRLGELCSEVAPDSVGGGSWKAEFQATLVELAGIDNHYLRKENELFPVLERHGVTGPSQVMWGVHDAIRAQLKEVGSLLAAEDFKGATTSGASLARAIIEMVYKEKKILLPLAQQTLTEEEWAAVRKGEDELGYAIGEPTAPFPSSNQTSPASAKVGIGLPIVSPTPTAPLPEGTDAAFVDLGTGRLSLEQVDMILRHLPIEISFVDADGFVRYYSETEDRLFPRTPGAIGRHVENCHPPKSLHMVKEILNKFAAGERDVAEFWIEMQERFIHIRYLAVRNQDQRYLGCLEVTQDVTGIRSIEGERRLLEWS